MAMIDNRSLMRELLRVGILRMETAPFLETEPDQSGPGPIDFDRVEGMLLGLAIGDSLDNTRETTTPSRRSSAPRSALCLAHGACPGDGSRACSGEPARTTTGASRS